MRTIDIHIPMSPNWLTLGPELDIGESEANTMIEQRMVAEIALTIIILSFYSYYPKWTFLFSFM